MAKKPTPKVKPAPAAKKKAAPLAPEPKAVATPKAHTRTVKPSETDRIEKGKQLAAGYLERRDGMDPQTALDIVESMSADDVAALIEEANTSTIAKTPETQPAMGARLIDDDDDKVVPIDFTTVEGLVGDETFPQLVIEAFDAAKRKNEADKEYKAKKAVLFAKMKSAGVKVDKDRVLCMGIKLAPYTGKSINLDKMKLLEAGVSVDLINKGYKTTEYDDVRMSVPKEAK